MSCCCLTCDPNTANSCFEQIIYKIDCGTRRKVIWESDLINPSGTVIVIVEESCSGLNLFINDKKVNNEVLEKGDTFAFTIDPLEIVEITCLTGSDKCIVKVSISVNYEVC